jgi:hypothetical protein
VVSVPYFEHISCRVAIQLCVGHFPSGRPRRRTISLHNIRRDASPDDIAAVVRALAPLLAYPIIKVRVVRKDALRFDEQTPGKKILGYSRVSASISSTGRPVISETKSGDMARVSMARAVAILFSTMPSLFLFSRRC